MTLNSLLPRSQGLRGKYGNQLFYNRSHFLLAVTDSWGKGFEGTVSVHVKRYEPLRPLEELSYFRLKPISEDSRVHLETLGENVLRTSVFMPALLRLERGHHLRLLLGSVQRVGRHLHWSTD